MDQWIASFRQNLNCAFKNELISSDSSIRAFDIFFDGTENNSPAVFNCTYAELLFQESAKAHFAHHCPPTESLTTVTLTENGARVTEEVPLSDMIEDKQTLTAICTELYVPGKRSWTWIFQDWNGRRRAKGLSVADRLQQYYIKAITRKWVSLERKVKDQVRRTEQNYRQYHDQRKELIPVAVYNFRKERTYHPRK